MTIIGSVYFGYRFRASFSAAEPRRL